MGTGLIRHWAIASTLVAATAGSSFAVRAEEGIVIGGASCIVKNFGSNTARKGVRYFDGELLNVTPSTRLSAVCPLSAFPLEPLTTVIVRLGNYTDAPQSFRCTLSEWDLGGNEVASYTRNVDVQASVVDGVVWEDVARADDGSKFVVECGVPPGGAISSLFSFGL